VFAVEEGGLNPGMYYFITNSAGIAEVARKSGLSEERVKALYDESLTLGVLCVFRVEAGYPPITSGLLKND
jgi:hypothetical protein